ncbi:DMT family transporter [Yoonia sp. R2331]|uniref:DMT family transporter n=1 Tax=Yoonia sp. R2331 TaxID=3237238 RepID=UPI0034E5B906
MAKAAAAPAPVLNYGRGIMLVLLANLLFSFVDTTTKWLIGAGLVVFQLAFMRYAVHFVITGAERMIRGKPATRLHASTVGLVLLRSFCLVSATLANFVALGQLSLSVTSALLYLSPIFICIFARLVLGEEIKRAHLVSIALGMAGALLILWPFGVPINWYAVLMLYPAMGIALYQVLSRKLTGVVTPGVLQFYTGALGTLALAPFAAFAWVAPPTPMAWGLLVAIGAFAWAGHEALTRAHAFATASALAPFGYSFVIYLTLAGMAVFADVPSPSVLIGAALIVLGGLFTWRYG